MKTRCWLLAIAFVALPVSLRAGDEAKSFSVPFDTIKTQHMVVNVKINGSGPYRLIFDTGAPDSLVNNKLAKEAGIFPKDFKKPPLALFGSMGQHKIKRPTPGDMVGDEPTGQFHQPGRGVIARAGGHREDGIEAVVDDWRQLGRLLSRQGIRCARHGPRTRCRGELAQGSRRTLVRSD